MAITLSRRTFLAATPLVFTAGTPLVAQAETYAGQFLSAEAIASPLIDGAAPTAHWQFRTNGKLPVIRARQGEELRLRLINTLPEDIWVHLYGVRVDPASTTVLMPAGPGSDVELVFTPPDAGTFWIGPLLKAAKQRDMGLSAMLIVEEGSSPYVDVPLILDDWRVDDAGKLQEDFNSIELAAGEGRPGNWYTVNGLVKPTIALDERQPVRLRLLNVSNTRSFNVQFRGLEGAIMALDGQPVKSMPLLPEGLLLAPGQRADVAVRTALADAAMLLDLSDDSVEAAFFASAKGLATRAGADLLPSNPWPEVPADAALRVIDIKIEGGLKGGLQSAKVGPQTLDLRGLLEKGLAWAINGASGLQETPLFEARQGEVLILNFINQTVFNQPLAIDAHVWHELEVDGQKTQGGFWRDTAVLQTNSQARYVFVASVPGLYTLSSLIAERADSGLIGAFRVTAGP